MIPFRSRPELSLTGGFSPSTQSHHWVAESLTFLQDNFFFVILQEICHATTQIDVT
jgi:hypothetical protein